MASEDVVMESERDLKKAESGRGEGRSANGPIAAPRTGQKIMVEERRIPVMVTAGENRGTAAAPAAIRRKPRRNKRFTKQKKEAALATKKVVINEDAAGGTTNITYNFYTPKKIVMIQQNKK